MRLPPALASMFTIKTSPDQRAQQAACASASHGLDVLEDRVDLPAVAVGVRQPELVLKRVAAGFPLFFVGDDAALLQSPLRQRLTSSLDSTRMPRWESEPP